MPTSVGFPVAPSTATNADKFHTDTVTIDALAALLERVKVVFGDPGSGTDVSAANPLPITLISQGSGIASPDVASALTDGHATVPTPGTAVAIAVSSSCKWVMLTALLTNTQQVNVGGAGASAAVGATKGTPLNAGDSVSIPVNDPSKVFVDARVAGEGVSFTVGS